MQINVSFRWHKPYHDTSAVLKVFATISNAGQTNEWAIHFDKPRLFVKNWKSV